MKLERFTTYYILLEGWQKLEMPFWSDLTKITFYSVKLDMCNGLIDGGMTKEVELAMERARLDGERR